MSHLEEDIYYKAKKRIKAKKGFYTHLGVYLACGVFFFLMNMLTWEGELWFPFPLLPWGIGLAIHGFSIFGLPGGKMSERWEEEELRKEVERQRRIHGVPEPNALELPEDELELKEFKKLREEWDDKDFV
jgi:2TM domain